MRGIKITVIIALAALLLLSLLCLLVFIIAAMKGSLEMFPTKERIDQVRAVYIIMSVFALFTGAIASIGLVKLRKSMRQK